MDFILHFAFCLMTQDFASDGLNETLETWIPSSFPCFSQFSQFSHLSKKKRHLKKTTYSIPSVQDCQTGRKYAYFRNTHTWGCPLSREPCIPCTRIQLPLVLCAWNLPLVSPGIFFGRTIPDLLGSDLMTTMVTLGIYLCGGLWKCYSWLFLFSLLDCQFSGYLYCVSCYLCGVLVVPCVFSFLFILCVRKVFSGLFPTSILNLLKASG